MVLELKVPHGTDHHHMLLTGDRINGAVLWTNLHLLFGLYSRRA